MRKNCSKSELLNFYGQLLALLKAGLPVIRVLEILGNESSKKINGRLKIIFQELHHGNSLAVSFKKAGFPTQDVNLIRIGEGKGNILESLDRIISHLRRTISSHEKIKKALMYPSIVLTISFLAVVLMLVFILPAFQNIFSEFNFKLPPITRMFLNISRNSPSILISIIGLLAAFCFIIRKDRVKLHIPVAGSIYRGIIYANICRSLGYQLKGGVPLLLGLNSIVPGLSNSLFREALKSVISSLENGEKFSDSLRKTRLFPETLLQIVKVGEESGSLDEVLIQAADYYEQEYENFIKKAITLVEPFSTLLVGGVVGLVAFSMILPLFSMMEAIK